MEPITEDGYDCCERLLLLNEKNCADRVSRRRSAVFPSEFRATRIPFPRARPSAICVLTAPKPASTKSFAALLSYLNASRALVSARI